MCQRQVANIPAVTCPCGHQVPGSCSGLHLHLLHLKQFGELLSSYEIGNNWGCSRCCYCLWNDVVSHCGLFPALCSKTASLVRRGCASLTLIPALTQRPALRYLQDAGQPGQHCPSCGTASSLWPEGHRSLRGLWWISDCRGLCSLPILTSDSWITPLLHGPLTVNYFFFHSNFPLFVS